MSELQAGMLAMIINSVNPENLGRIVQLVRRVTPGGVEPEIPWGIAHVDGWLIEGGLYIQGKERDFGTAPDKNLMPIKPEADPLDVTHKEELHA
jgi:hypothetical protein